MRRVLLVALLAAAGGCYLFSDEPKVRKQAGDAAQGQDEPAHAASGAPSSAPEPDAVERPEGCPALLVGVESKARTIASACGSVTVRGAYRIEGGSLTLEPGVELRVEPGAAIEVGRDVAGTLIVAGTAEQPVRMVAAGEHAAGQDWAGLRLYARASGSRLEHLELVGAGTLERAAVHIDAPEVRVAGLRVEGSAALALELGEGARNIDLSETSLIGAGVVAKTTAMGAASLLDLHLDPGAAIAIAAGKIDAPIEWPRNNYRIEGPIQIAGVSPDERSAQLSLAPGVELGFGPAGRLVVGGLGPGVLSASASPLPKLLGPASDSPADGVPLAPAPNPLEGSGSAEPDGVEGLDPSRSDLTVLRAAGDAAPGAWGGISVEAEGQLIFRNIEIAHGGSRGEGVILAQTGAKLSLEGCSLRDNLVGVELRGTQIALETLRDNEFIGTPVALRANPALVGEGRLELGANRYGPGTRIELTRGRVELSATWDARAVELLLTGEVYVDKGATLTVSPGSHLRFAADALLAVGYYEHSSLELRGSAEAPIELGPQSSAAPVPWGGVVLGPHAHKVRFENLRMSQTAGSGIALREGADATLVRVDCRDCGGPTVRWDCASTVGNIAVSASGTTPEALQSPSDCG